MHRRGVLYRSVVVLAGSLALVALPATANATLARTPVPYMGWNTYYQVGSKTPGSNNITESTIKSVAQSLVSTGMANAGYTIVWLDFGWASGARDGNGSLIVDTAQWPNGLSALTSYLHGLGLQAGIYTDAGTSGCSGQGVGSYGHYQQDADQFAAWGFDAVKVDFCGGTNMHLVPSDAYGKFRDALLANRNHRPMLFNICNPFTPGAAGPGDPPPERSVYESYRFGPTTGNSWRTDTDVGFVHSVQWADVLRNLDHDAAHPEAAGSGHWNDPDYLGPELGMTSAQARAQFTMWSVLAAPLIVGSDVRALSQDTVDMLTNRDVLAVDQDRLGVQGTRIASQGLGDVWVRRLANGDRAVALLNRGTTPLTITTSATAAGLGHASRYTLNDLWSHARTESAGTIRASVPPGSAVLYRVSPGASSGLAPATALDAPTVPTTSGWTGDLALPGRAAAVTAGFVNTGRSAVTGLELSLDAPSGWTGGGAAADGGTVPTGRTVTGRWQVTAP